MEDKETKRSRSHAERAQPFVQIAFNGKTVFQLFIPFWKNSSWGKNFFCFLQQFSESTRWFPIHIYLYLFIFASMEKGTLRGNVLYAAHSWSVKETGFLCYYKDLFPHTPKYYKKVGKGTRVKSYFESEKKRKRDFCPSQGKKFLLKVLKILWAKKSIFMSHFLLLNGLPIGYSQLVCTHAERIMFVGVPC